MHTPRIEPKLGRWETRAIIMVALLLFIGPAIGFAAGSRGHPQENRLPLPFPGPRSGWHVLDKLGKALNDRMPLRSDAIRVDGWADEHVFDENRAYGGSALPAVFRGERRFLFLAEDIQMACVPAASEAVTADDLRQVMTAIQASGRDVVTMVAPNKTTILESLLRPTPVGLDCYHDYTTRLWQQLDAAAIPGWVDLRAALEAAGTADTPVYLHTDSHWNSIGSLVAVHAMVDRLAPGLWKDSEVYDAGPIPWTGDLSLLQGSPSSELKPTRIVTRPDIEPVSTTTLDTGTAFDAHRYLNSGPPGRLIPGHTVLFMDSFGAVSMDQIVPYFADLTVVHLNSFQPETFLSFIQDADHVWFMSVERHISDRMAAEWATPEFLAQLRGLAG